MTTTKQGKKKQFNYSHALRQLPQNARVGCVALVVERALEGYPATLKSQFHLDDALETAWGFANTGTCDPQHDDQIADTISDELGALEQAGYTYDHGLMGISLLLGCRQPASLLAAVEYAGRVWALGPGVTPEEKAADPDGLRGPVYTRLQRVAEACKLSKPPARWESFIRASAEVAPTADEPTEAPTQKKAKAAKKKTTSEKPAKMKAKKPAKKKTKKPAKKKAKKVAKKKTKKPAKKKAKKVAKKKTKKRR